MLYGPTSIVSRRRSTIASAWVRRVKIGMLLPISGRTSMAGWGSSRLSIRPRGNGFECYSKRSAGSDGVSWRMSGGANVSGPHALLLVVIELVDDELGFE